jgi:hypothetical protein
MRVFPVGVKDALNISVDRSKDTHFGEQHWSAVLGSIDQHLNCKSPFRRVMFGFGKLLDIICGVAERSSRWPTWQGDRLIEGAFPGHNTTPQQELGIQPSRGRIRSPWPGFPRRFFIPAAWSNRRCHPLSGPGLSLPIEIRPDVGTAPAAALANEPRFKIG